MNFGDNIRFCYVNKLEIINFNFIYCWKMFILSKILWCIGGKFLKLEFFGRFGFKF